MYRRLVLLIVFIVSIPGLLAASTLGDNVREHRLENGATLLLIERHTSPTVAAYISFRVGSVNETSEERGAAHLLEHMLFKGTKTLGTRNYAAEEPMLEQINALGAQIDRLKNQVASDPHELERLRAELTRLQKEHRQFVVTDEFSRIYAENGGIGYNAFTGKDQTTYLINLPANKLELWAAIESDRLQNAVFREFYTERDVVAEERRRSYESNPQGMLYETLLATAYKVHPYRDPVIGWESDIANLSPEKIRGFFSRYYTPVNMVITLVGEFESVAAIELVERYFGKLNPGVPVPPVSDREPQQRGERRVVIDFDCENSMMIAFHKPTMPQAEDYAFDILMQVLADGRASRLYRELVVEQEVASSVDIFSAPGARYDNLMIIRLEPRSGHSTAEVEAALYRELERLQDEPFSEAEIAKARKQITMGQMRRLKSNSGLARTLSSFEVLGDWRYLLDYEEKLNMVNAQDIMKIAERYLTADNRTVAILSRGGEG